MSINIDSLTRSHFYFDTPVNYKLKKGEVNITPINLKDSELFLYASSILDIDKNSMPDVEIIQMSYLQFIVEKLLEEGPSKDLNRYCFYAILNLCLGLDAPFIRWKNQKYPVICEKDLDIEITPKEFDDIKTIIMHQNIPHYDDEYINPELKKAMNDVDELKSKDKESPNLERRIAIITAHTGLPKREQLLMTYRSHVMLFEEVCGEADFNTIRPPFIARGLGKEIDHWIFRKRKDKFEGYIKSVDAYTQSMGGTNNIKSSSAEAGVGDSYMQQFNNFNQN